MSELLEKAILQVRQLPEAEQDLAAEMLMHLVARHREPIALDPDTRAAVREALAQVDRGEIVPDVEMAAFFARHR